MTALDRKLLRDLWQMRSQALAIALVVASGVALFVGSRITFASLEATRDAFYRLHGFADVFARAKRVPNARAAEIAGTSGVGEVATRVVVDVTLDVPGMILPAAGRLISVPERGRAVLNAIELTAGRYIAPGRAHEAVVHERFAAAHGLGPGDRVAAIINGRRKQLEIVGVALSPEYVYTVSPGELFPDARRFGVFWMAREPLATAFDMEEGFNDVSVLLQPGASEAGVIEALDRILEPYGGLGATPRALQTSHWYLTSELQQLSRMGALLPSIFLFVAAFLLNVVLSRIVAVQREQIAALKALGYSNTTIGVHYLWWALSVALAGGLIGVGAGLWLSRLWLGRYTEYFTFPWVELSWSMNVVAGSVGIGLLAAGIGALSAVRLAVRLPPAEAMRPASPASYRRSLVERLGLSILLDTPSRIIVRNIVRRPVRTLLSVTGIAFAGSIMIVGSSFVDSIDELLRLQFDVSQRQDVTVNFVEPLSERARYDLARLPGVQKVEEMRSVPVRLRLGQRSRQVGILGLEADSELYRVVDARGRARTVPDHGLLMSQTLADVLEVKLGERLEVEVLEGRRPSIELPVVQLIDDYVGTSAYMEAGALRRFLRESGTLSGAALQVDDGQVDRLFRALKQTPAVAGVGIRQATIDSFQTFLADNMGQMLMISLLFAAIIAFGVIYNTARIALSERNRELASLRVMGFTRGEISYILLGELFLLMLLALPAGSLLGYGLLLAAVQMFESELYRLPLIVQPESHLLGTVTVVVSTVISAAIVRGKLHRLDLIGVLKTRE